MTTKLAPVGWVSRPGGHRVRANLSDLAPPLEVAAVVLAPLVLYVVLGLRGMAPGHIPDPSMHSTFIFDPHAIFARYQAVFTPTSRLREAARVGFLVPARLAYLVFGAVPGFFVYRYVLALVAIVPVYLLMRRLHGRWAGFLAIAVIMSSPVVITAWGTDYPDSAALSYLTGGLAALALSLAPDHRRRAGWLIGGSVILTLAVWSHGAAVPLAGAFGVSYLGVRLVHERSRLARDVVLLAGGAVATTGILAIGSKFLIGQFNFIAPTLRAASYLSAPAQMRQWHSSAWTWAPYDPYLLVAPTVVLAFSVALAGRLRGDVPRLFLGLAGTLAVVVFGYLQFYGGIQVLEIHYFSSLLWSALNVMFIIALAEIASPLPVAAIASAAGRWLRAAAPALLVIAVALAYALVRPHFPAMTWGDAAFVLGVIAVGAAVVGRAAVVEGEDRRRAGALARGAAGNRVLSASAVVVMTASVLILTVVPGKAHAIFANTVYDPPPAYAGALGGSATRYIDQYQVVSELPAFVGPPAYRGEQLLTWWPKEQTLSLQGAIGIYHASFNQVSWSFPRLNDNGARKISTRHAAQILLMGLSDQGFSEAVRSLARFSPVVVRQRDLRDGGYGLDVWLVELRSVLRARSEA